MAAWNESTPDDSSLVNEGDNEIRSVKEEVRSRMALEHLWPSSQVATNEGGLHKHITLSALTAAPSLVVGTNTQRGALFVMSSSNALMFEDSAGTSYVLAASGAGPTLFAGTGTVGSIPIATTAGGFIQLVASATNTVIVSNGATVAPSYKAVSAIVNVGSGLVAHGATIGSLSGFSSSECICFVSPNIIGGYTGGDGDNLQGIKCEVSASRVVTCTGVTRNNVTVTGTANYIIYGIKA